MTKKAKRRVVKNRTLRVAHVVPATPYACGMYETARELVAAERALGIQAHIVDPRPYRAEVEGTRQKGSPTAVTCPKCSNEFKIVPNGPPVAYRPADWEEDRGVSIAPVDWAVNHSDVIVSHAGLSPAFAKHAGPWIHVAHGRPNSSYRIERMGQTPIYKTYREMRNDARWKAMVTLWPSYKPYLELLFPEVRVCDSFVDLDHWAPGGSPIHDWGEDAGTPNAIITDVWRADKDPFHVLNAFRIFADRTPGAKVHVIGIDGNDRGRSTILDALRDRGCLGTVSKHVPDLRPYYRAADLLLTPHTIATRTVREAMASGLMVVGGRSNQHTPFGADTEDLQVYSSVIGEAWACVQRDRTGSIKARREYAEEHFNAERTARQFVSLFEEFTGRNVA